MEGATAPATQVAALPLAGSSEPTADPAAHAAATRLQANYRGHSARKHVSELKRTAAEEAAYEKSNREREHRMRQREAQKAMLLDLPAGEVEDWVIQQEHAAAITVQSNFRRHKAKKEVAAAREAARSRPSPSLAGVDTPDAYGVLSAEYDASSSLDLDEPASTRPTRPVEHMVASLKMEHSRRELGLPETTMETYIEGRQRTDRLMREYRERESKNRDAAAARRATCAQAERTYRAQRGAAHGSLAELPADADPARYPDPPGIDPKQAKRLHKELMDAAQAELKWWKPLVALNREQRVADQQEEERRKGKGNAPAPRVSDGYLNNRDRAGVASSYSGSFASYGSGSFGSDHEDERA